MGVTPTEPLERLRRPEYTGENRCIPCTIVNLVIAVVAAGAVASAVTAVSDAVVGSLLGGVLFVVFAAVIYLRGYLVPGTPWLTRTYFPDRVLRWFDKEPIPGGEGGEIDVEQILDRAGVVTECEHENDLCLTDEFRTAWRERIATLRERETPRGELADVLDVDADRLLFKDFGNAFVAYLDDRSQRIGQWESRGAFLADVAAAEELRERYRGWSRIESGQQGAVLQGLRIFLERCPDCDGDVSIDQEVVNSCCRSVDVVAVTCQDCDARLLEAPQSEPA